MAAQKSLETSSSTQDEELTYIEDIIGVMMASVGSTTVGEICHGWVSIETPKNEVQHVCVPSGETDRASPPCGKLLWLYQ